MHRVVAMSETRRDLGPLNEVVTAAMNVWVRWLRFSPTERAEIISLLFALNAITLNRQAMETRHDLADHRGIIVDE